MMTVTGLVKRFPGVMALDGVDLDIRAGEIHALVGENGAGKSTLVKALAGIHAPDSGTMTFDGAPYTPASAADGLAAGISVVHQELALLPYLTVAENLFLRALPRTAGVVDRKRLRADAERLLAEIGLDVSPDTLVERLGIAQMQLVEIAKAISTDCRLLIMDEPTATLTSREAGRLFGILRTLRERGVAIVYISHHLQEVLELADRVTVLRNGRSIETREMAGVTAPDLVRLMVGRDLAQEYPAKPPTALGEVALKVRDLKVAGFEGPLSFSVRRGEVVGLAGLVGSGRTEAMRAIFGADPALSENIELYGKKVRIRHPQDAVRHGISLLTEDRKSQGLVLDLPISANVTLAKLRGFLVRFGQERSLAEGLGRRLHLRSAGVDQHVRTLSGGNQQKVVLAKWLNAGSDILIVDEPTRGIDVGAKYEIHELLLGLAAEGKALLVVSSDLPELMGICDRVLVFSRGKIAGEVARADFDAEHILTLAYSGYLKNGETQ
ncbi:sugar ABC transporter ATP-binding protein [Nonomuraea guangzhouensis]|uniref:Sugar ABC transporter ATP-binding protein n=1 Tax=Nonomuraea guangzhouensis TaxID=1291555 RepID=A0ABW4GKD7_9ACTN|nr:sugar ABC transporter ATP-binding protein [Nonomuraea guangzhouensis]